MIYIVVILAVVCVGLAFLAWAAHSRAQWCVARAMNLFQLEHNKVADRDQTIADLEENWRKHDEACDMIFDGVAKRVGKEAEENKALRSDLASMTQQRNDYRHRWMACRGEDGGDFARRHDSVGVTPAPVIVMDLEEIED